MRSKVILVKLAAIGDVALACRALKDFHRRYEALVDFHWIIDRNLVGLARSILGEGLDVTWHPVDAAALFQGGAATKARVAAGMLAATVATRPEQIVLLHRDWRYQALLRAVSRRPLITVNRERISELDAYARALDELATRLRAPRADEPRASGAKTARALSGKIGVLVGGARSQKVDFAEKRWPAIVDLVVALVHKRADEIVLFGSEDDAPVAEQALGRLADPSRVTNLVGKLALERLPVELSKLDAFISIDSGLAHIASAVMTATNQRVVTLFGPTDPRIWAPTAAGQASARVHYKGRPCSPCYANDGNFRPCQFEGEYFQHCMTAITVDEVLNSLP